MILSKRAINKKAPKTAIGICASKVIIFIFIFDVLGENLQNMQAGIDHNNVHAKAC
jgi:hypothetical protein